MEFSETKQKVLEKSMQEVINYDTFYYYVTLCKYQSDCST